MSKKLLIILANADQKNAQEVGAPSVQIGEDDLISEVDESVSAAYVVSEAMDDNTVTFTY